MGGYIDDVSYSAGELGLKGFELVGDIAGVDSESQSVC